MYNLVKRSRSCLLVFLTHKLALPVLKLIRRPEQFPYTVKALQQFPINSLGYDLVHFLHRKELQLLPYYARHDIKHILLQYNTTDEGEGCLQCFMLGNGHVSFPVIATVLYGFVTMPEYWGSLRKAYRRGRKCSPIDGWKWFEILHIPTKELQDKVDKKQ